MTPKKSEPDRNRVMAELTASRDEQLKLELASAGLGSEPFEAAPQPEPKPEAPKEEAAPAEPEAPAPVAEPETEPEPKAAPAPEPEKTPEPQTEPPAVEMVTVKIDGEVMQVPKADVDKAGSVNLYQLEQAMIKRLKETNERNKELGEVLRQLRQPAQADQTPKQDPNQALVERINALRFGTDEEATKAMQDLMRPANPPVEQIVDHVQKRIQWDTAVKQFQKDYGDLIQDPDIRTIVIARENLLKQQIMSQGQWPEDIAKFYQDLGPELRKKFGKPAAIDLAARREEKARLAEPSAAAGKIPAAPQEKEESVSDKINQLRKARGQAPLT